jgi:arsenate reductase (thioredoxin)
VKDRIDECRYVARQIEICQYVFVTKKLNLTCCVVEAPLRDAEAELLAERLKALADPTRLRVVSMLATAPTGELCACVFPDALEKSQPTVSHHLALLVNAGLVDRAQRGKWAWFRLRPEALASIRVALGEGVTPVRVRKPVVLFLCVHNAGRSQMAAGYLRSLAGESIEVLSAGSSPGAALNPMAVEAMREDGIDITAATPQRWTSDMLANVDVVVSMGCGDDCPVVPGTRVVDWELDDPAGQDIAFVRRVRDQIKERVTALAAELTAGCC